MIDLPLANNENLHHNTMESDEHKGTDYPVFWSAFMGYMVLF